MSSTNDIGMDIPTRQFPNIKSKVRGRNSFLPVNLSRESSVASSGCSTPYHERMNVDMNLPSEESQPEMSYKTEQEKAIQISMAANQQETARPTNVHNEALPSHAQHKGESINIQLPYDPHAPTKPELWSGSFHPISLHGSIEHFALDAKNIKVTLNFLATYIRNKQVIYGEVKNLENFDGIGNAIWNFLSFVYEAKWDALYTDHKSNTLRTKILSKFTQRMIPPNNGNKKDIPKSVPVTINKVSPLLPLLAKSKKEINTISKYFKKPMVDNSAHGTNVNSGKSYAQASKTSASTSEVLKIKETFPSLNAQKIDQVNNIVNSSTNPKPHIRMTTKGPSRK